MKKRWSKEEFEFLEKNYNKMFVSEISKKIGRTQKSIKQMASRKGIKLEEIEFTKRMKYGANKMREHFNGMSGEDNPNWKGGISKDNYHYKQLQKERYPKKVNAREKVASAIRSGLLKQEPCAICGSPNTQAHHEDYNKPLDVIWLCPKHHREAHNQ